MTRPSKRKKKRKVRFFEFNKKTRKIEQYMTMTTKSIDDEKLKEIIADKIKETPNCCWDVLIGKFTQPVATN